MMKLMTKKQKLGLAVFILLIAVLPALVILSRNNQDIRNRAAGTSEVNVSFNPSTGTKPIGTPFDLELRVNKNPIVTAGRDILVSGAQATVTVSDKFIINSATCKSPFDGLKVARITGQSITFMCAIGVGAEPVSTTGLGTGFADINLTPKDDTSGVADITFDSTRITEAGIPGQAPDVSNAGQNATFTISSNTPSITPTPVLGINCPCGQDPTFDNFCTYPPGTNNCSMTMPGGFCDPNGDGNFSDADWARGYDEYQSRCNDSIITPSPTSTITCKEFSPPAPGWCSDGTIVDGGTDWLGCKRPPICDHKCVTAGGSCGMGFAGPSYPLGTCCEGFTCVESGNPDQGGTCQPATTISCIPYPTTPEACKYSDPQGGIPQECIPRQLPPDANYCPPPPQYCTSHPFGDANCDGRISLVDMEIFRREFNGQTLNGLQADFNGDGKISLVDYEILRRNFGRSFPESTPNQCPLSALPYCPDGELQYVKGADTNGCPLPPICINPGITGSPACVCQGGTFCPNDDPNLCSPPVIIPPPACCSAAQTSQGYQCIVNCGPPVSTQNDPHPGFSCMSPTQIQNRLKFGCPL